MEKDCKMIFVNKLTYDFPFSNIGLAIKTVHEKGWKIAAIHTPYGVLSMLTEDEYKNIISAFAENV